MLSSLWIADTHLPCSAVGNYCLASAFGEPIHPQPPAAWRLTPLHGSGLFVRPVRYNGARDQLHLAAPLLCRVCTLRHSTSFDHLGSRPLYRSADGFAELQCDYYVMILPLDPVV